MAAEKETEEMETFVQEFLDKTFGDRLEDLGTAAKTVESLERKRDLLKTKVYLLYLYVVRYLKK